MPTGFYIVPLIWAGISLWLGINGRFRQYFVALVAVVVGFLAYLKIAFGAGLTDASTLTAAGAFAFFGIAAFGVGWLFRRNRRAPDA